MRFLPIASLVLALFATPAFAQTAPTETASTQAAPSGANADTYREILQHGLIIVTPGADIDVTFQPDGRFVAFNGLAKGSWKIVGDLLCTTPDDTRTETCAAYPAGKKSGEQFEFDTPSGRGTFRIN